MDKMRMESPDMTAKNIDKIAELFPDCITETPICKTLRHCKKEKGVRKSECWYTSKTSSMKRRKYES
jgi:adenine-specific DNA-methyltransferase